MILTSKPRLLKQLQALDLTQIENRLLHKHGWCTERIVEAIAGYRQFLYFTQMFSEPISPTADIDSVWHEHLLHTRKYMADCQELFGDFLHHTPKPVTAMTSSLIPGCDNANCCNDGAPGKTTITDDSLTYTEALRLYSSLAGTQNRH
jgi:hypothetical protein